jgi:hypothetical protein
MAVEARVDWRQREERRQQERGLDARGCNKSRRRSAGRRVGFWKQWEKEEREIGKRFAMEKREANAVAWRLKFREDMQQEGVKHKRKVPLSYNFLSLDEM